MIDIRGTFKTESMLLSATIMSIVVHCMIASLLFLCLKVNKLAPFIPTIISVDIRSLEPASEEKPHLRQPPRSKQHNKLHSDPPVRIMPVLAQFQKPKQVQEREPSTAQTVTRQTVKPPVSPPLQERIDSPHTLQVETNPVSMTFPDKSAPSRKTETVDINVKQSYLVALKEIIERHKEYPLIAKRGRMEGTVRISCTLTRSGEMREAIIADSSGHEILDKAALRAVRSAGRFPVVPNEIKSDPFCFVAPITFRLSAD
jgi:protein TonB